MATPVLLLSSNIFFLEVGSSCTTPNGEEAECISIYSCSILYSALTVRSSIQIRFLRESQCGYDEDPLVCCGSSSTYTSSTTSAPRRKVTTTRKSGGQNNRNNNLLPDRSSCGIQVFTRKGFTSLMHQSRC